MTDDEIMKKIDSYLKSDNVCLEGLEELLELISTRYPDFKLTLSKTKVILAMTNFCVKCREKITHVCGDHLC